MESELSSACGMMMTEQDRNTRRKTCLSAFCAIKYTWSLVNIKIDLRSVGCECVNWSRQMVSCGENENTWKTKFNVFCF